MSGEMDSGKNRAVVLGVLAAGMLLRLYLASLDLKVLLPDLLSDDMFYYLKVARNIAHGLGASFDGINMTNGFQPLYALFLTLMYTLMEFTADAPIRIALAVLSIFDVLTGLVIYKTLLVPQFGLSRRSALLGMAFWVFNPFVISGTFYGLETALSTFFVSLAIYAYVKTRYSGCGTAGCISVGLLLGAAVLARMDSAFLAIAVAVDLILQGRLRPLFLAASAVLLVCLPWFAWSYVNFGMLQQDSGAVISYVNNALSGGFLSRGYLSARAGSLYMSLRILAMFLSSMILPLFFTAAVVVKNPESRVFSGGFPWKFIAVFCVLLVLYYPIVMGGVTRRYYQPVVVAFSLVIAVAFDGTSKAKGRRNEAIFALLMVSNLLLAGFAYWLYRPVSQQSWHLDLYETALWINGNAMPGDIIGGFNSGIIGYFSNRTVVNLDGVINDGAYRAIAAGNLSVYIRNQNIKYLVDNENTFKAVKPFMGDEDFEKSLREVYKRPLHGNMNEHIVVYEVV